MTSYSSVRTYVEELNDFVKSVYADFCCAVEESGYTSLPTYQLTYTDNGTTFSLDVKWFLHSYTYYDICLRFGSITVK